MKQKLFAAFMMLATVAMVFNGCKKKDSDNDSSPSSGMSAKVNGASWSANNAGISATLDNGLIEITGVASNGNSMDFTINGSTTGTYFLSALSGNQATYTELTGTVFTSDFSPTSGTFIITNLNTNNKTMSGTFKFTGIDVTTFDSVVVSSGTFTNIVYTTPTGGGANLLTCKVDGVDYIGANLSVTDNVLAVNAIEIQSTSSTGPYPKLNIIIPDTQTPGTYLMASTGNDGYYYASSSAPIAADQSGSLTISVHNTTTRHIEGTFSFTAQDFGASGPVYNITNGIFVANY